jgi:hypothetical protein
VKCGRLTVEDALIEGRPASWGAGVVAETCVDQPLRDAIPATIFSGTRTSNARSLPTGWAYEDAR